MRKGPPVKSMKLKEFFCESKIHDLLILSLNIIKITLKLKY